MTNSSSSSSSSDADSSSSSSISSADPVDGSLADSCTWYAGEACVVPRACGDCLNAALASGDSCALDSTLGMCVPLGSVASGSVDDASGRYFTAARNSYCSGEDATCAACRAKWLEQYEAVGYVRASSAVCVGDGGCLCVAACVDPEWSAAVLSDQCALVGGVFSRAVACIGIGGCVLVLLLFVCACLRRWTQEHEHPTLAGIVRRVYLGTSDAGDDEQGRQRPGTELEVFYFRRYGRRRPQSPRAATHSERALALPAWSSMREALIESEKRRTEAPPRLTRACSTSATDLEADEHVEVERQQPE